MDKWAPMAPKSGSPSRSATPGAGGSVFSGFSVMKPSKAGAASTRDAEARRRAGITGPRVGRWPEDIIARIVGFLPVHAVPNFARANRALARIARDEETWRERCRLLGVGEPDPESTPDPTPSTGSAAMTTPRKTSSSSVAGSRPIAAKPRSSPGKQRAGSSNTNSQFAIGGDDDFGDFGEADVNDAFEDVDFGDFQSPARSTAAFSPTINFGGFSPVKSAKNETSLLDFDEVPLPSRPQGKGSSTRTTGFFAIVPPTERSQATGTNGKPGRWYNTYKRRHLHLIPYCVHLRSSPSPSSTLSVLFPLDSTTGLPPRLEDQGKLLLSLLHFLSSRLQPLHDWGFLRQALLAATDRFDSTCLVAFETADAKKDEEGMRTAAEASWQVWEAAGGAHHEWECGRVWVEKREVFYDTARWDATENIMKVPAPSGTAIIRQLDFTPMDAFMSHVLESFRLDADLAIRVFPERAKVVLEFAERLATDVIGEYIQTLLGATRVMSPDLFLRATAASFVQAWKLVDICMETLGERQNATNRRGVENVIYEMFGTHLDEYLEEEAEWAKTALSGICNAWTAELKETTKTNHHHHSPGGQPQFLTSQNPDQVKRNVLAGFKDVLLLPVTIVPRTVTLGVNAIVTGGTQAVNGLSMLNPQKWAANTENRGQKGKLVNGEVVFDGSVPMPDEEDDSEKKKSLEGDEIDALGETVRTSLTLPQQSNGASATVSEVGTAPPSVVGTKPPSPVEGDVFDSLQLLVSLDTALELIHADRESLKRTETFARYPGKTGNKVREAIEEIFIQLLKAVGDQHIAPGFGIATQQMLTYKPADQKQTSSVAPLLQFFELVHVGDTIQSMVQVYFDKEISPYVDKTDFLNPVMREKKRFEGVLDDAVAAGLNAGIEVLMNQVEHIILTKTGPREYYPEPGQLLELGPTEGCREAIACLETHCNLLKGSTSKEVLEVFYQEVGIRLEGILHRHLKRQIISLEGGFQIIADLNAYHGFIQSLKQQRITDDFANLKMLGHVFIVSDAKDLAQIVRDVTRYGGSFTPEDVYEFIQRRSDWKKIEKTVDKAMYALSVREDCVVM